MGVRHMQHAQAGALEECHRHAQQKVGCCTYIVLCAGSSSWLLSLKCSVGLADGCIVPVPLVGVPHCSLLRLPRCARQAELRSGAGERHSSSVQPRTKRPATGARRALGGSTQSNTDSPSPAHQGSNMTMLPPTALKSTHKSVLPGGQASVAQAIIQNAKSRVRRWPLRRPPARAVPGLLPKLSLRILL